MPKYSWITLLILAALLGLSSIGILFAGVDAGDFLSSTGVEWENFAQAQPGVAAYIERLEALLGVSGAGLGLLVTLVALNAYRRGERWAWYAAVVYPLMLAGFSAVFFTYEAQALAIYYVVLAGVGLAAVLPAYRSIVPPSA